MLPNHHNPYQAERNREWTRIDMLQALYSAALDETEAVSRMIRSEPIASGRHRLRAIALVNAIESGLDLSQGELPQRIQQLCEFVCASLVDADPARIDASVKILRNLHEGFSGIRDEAVRMEEDGAIRPLKLPSYDTTA